MEVSGRQYKAKWHFRKCCYRCNEVPIYWLCKQEIAHTTNYQLLLSLANIITLRFGGGEGEGHASRPPEYQNISIIPLYFFFWGKLCMAKTELIHKDCTEGNICNPQVGPMVIAVSANFSRKVLALFEYSLLM